MPDRIILVTGVAGEIGGYLVDQLLKDDWIVCGLDRRSPPISIAQIFLSKNANWLMAQTSRRRLKIFTSATALLTR